METLCQVLVRLTFTYHERKPDVAIASPIPVAATGKAQCCDQPMDSAPINCKFSYKIKEMSIKMAPWRGKLASERTK